MKYLLPSLLMTGHVFAQVQSVTPTGNGITPATRDAFLSKLGATTLGTNFLRAPNQASVTFPRINADNTVTFLSEAGYRSALNTEPALGNPPTDGYVLSSTTSGTRSWVAQSGGGGSSSVIVPTGLVADAKRFTNGVVSGTSLISATASFTSGDVGKLIRVQGAGALGADLVTTIANPIVSSTQVTLTVAATTAIPSGAIFYYGTNNSASINTAIADASASSTVKKVFIPRGFYLANIKIMNGVEVFGELNSITQDYEASDAFWNTSFAANTRLSAATSAPVIDCDLSYGAGHGASMSAVHRLTLVGGGKKGYGLRYGIADGTQSGFIGSSFNVDRILATGFDYGIAVSRCANFMVSNCELLACRIGYNFGEADSITTLRYTDGATLIDCAAHGCSKSARFAGTKGATLQDCDFGGGTSGGAYEQQNAVVQDGGILHIVSMNVERCESDIIRKTDGSLLLSAANTLTTTNCVLVSEYSATNNVNTVILSHAGALAPWGTASTIGILWRGVSNTTTWPTISSTVSGVMRKYTTTSWTTELETVRVSDHFAPIGSQLESPLVTDKFTRIGGSPYGEMGWVVGNLVNSAFVASAGTNSLRLSTGDAVATNVGRLATDAVFAYLTSNYEMRISIRDEEATTNRKTKIRAGLYTLTPSTFTPANGFGFRYDPSPVTAGSFVIGRTYAILSAGTTDFTLIGSANNTVGTVFVATGVGSGTGTAGLANIWLETINASTVTDVETNLLGTQLSSFKYLCIRRTAQGTYGTIKSTNGVPLGTWNVGGTLNSVDVAPAVISGAIVSVYPAFHVNAFAFRGL